VAAESRITFRDRRSTCSAVALTNPAADFHSPFAPETASFSMRRAPPVLEANDVNASEGTVCMGDKLIWLCMR
jgi:hypothetical protein